MPGQDRTGPFGEGPLTGRGAGGCADGGNAGFGRNAGFGPGRRGGFGGRRGGGRRGGFGRMFGGFGWNAAPADEKGHLDSLIDYLAERLDSLKKRRTDIDND
ncbi:MAG: DUF5320 domain-containing protein [Candidatus Cloacimonetes bacterium]|nr:DUF5320 domain-containing protein [Candidatus Cloacimonadota bacterium]